MRRFPSVVTIFDTLFISSFRIHAPFACTYGVFLASVSFGRYSDVSYSNACPIKINSNAFALCFYVRVHVRRLFSITIETYHTPLFIRYIYYI